MYFLWKFGTDKGTRSSLGGKSMLTYHRRVPKFISRWAPKARHNSLCSIGTYKKCIFLSFNKKSGVDYTTLFCIFNCSRFSNNSDFYVTWVIKVIFDSFTDITCQSMCFQIIDLFRLNDYANFSSCLNGE